MKNKTGKYLKYAIGEIILVVIGILIALQINNWNESAKEQQKESVYLNNLQRDLNDQIASIDQQILYETRFVEDASYLITYYSENGLKNLDSIFFTKLSNLHSRKTFVITDPTYTDLLSSGSINLIKTQNLKDHLIQYYQELERVEKVIQNNNSLLTDQQYGPVFFNLGYFHPDPELNKLNSDKMEFVALRKLYVKELAETSENLLSEPNNQLRLMNVINLRHLIGLAHLESMQQSKKNTTKLLVELSNSTND
ncbi:hypothetical protein SAMN04515667_1057 [Formosa sp. Hel1_31_208]|uniref:DUF6090 family protein n=1 Tax=Formosa sp. Hel1_31_208 TaxID=1798225 RepID=UPI00087C9FE7|nr:DUF6090 family protein [Formosa sp. Hel1_31_208]SDR94760.1 hypothetical protein SAMN04515667_1057 [Formosa sp. Hel1_31_208]